MSLKIYGKREENELLLPKAKQTSKSFNLSNTLFALGVSLLLILVGTLTFSFLQTKNSNWTKDDSELNIETVENIRKEDDLISILTERNIPVACPDSQFHIPSLKSGKDFPFTDRTDRHEVETIPFSSSHFGTHHLVKKISSILNLTNDRENIDNTKSYIASPQGKLKFHAEPANDLQPLFDARYKGWAGADVATSFRLPSPNFDGETTLRNNNTRYGWIFGDTFIGYCNETSRIMNDTIMIHNSIGTIEGYQNPSKQAKSCDVSFYWDTRAYQRHENNIARKKNCTCIDSLFIDKEEPNTVWIWPISAISVYIPEKNISKAIFLAVRYTPTKDILPDDMKNKYFRNNFNNLKDDLGFRVLSSSIIIVHNADEVPSKWQYDTINIPTSEESFTPGDEQFNWWTAITYDKDQNSGGINEVEEGEIITSLDSTVYIVGNVNNNKTSAQLISRIPISSLLNLNFDGFEVLAINDDPKSTPIWINYQDVQLSVFGTSSPKPQINYEHYAMKKNLKKNKNSTFYAFPLFLPGASEGTLFYSEKLQQWAFVCIFPYDIYINLGLSSSVEGPWDFTRVYKIPDVYTTAPLMSYAAKYHRELSMLPPNILTERLSTNLHSRIDKNLPKLKEGTENILKRNTAVIDANIKFNKTMKETQSFIEEMIFTYMTNSAGDIVPLFNDGGKDKYVPNFVRLRFYS